MEPEQGQGIPQEVTQGFQTQESENTGGGQEGINPAWNDLLGVIPEDLHSQVTPHLQNWDRGVQTRFQQVQSKYSDYEPFVDSGVSPDEINFGLGLANAIATNPQEVFNALQEYIGVEESQDQQNLDQGQQNSPNSPASDPRLDQMEQVIQVLAQNTLSQREQAEQEQADAEFDAELDDLHEKYGDFDEEIVIGILMANEGMETEQAVQAYQNKVNEIRSQSRRPGPNVMGAGGAVPNKDIDVRKLDQKSTRGLAADMLRQYYEQD